MDEEEQRAGQSSPPSSGPRPESWPPAPQPSPAGPDPPPPPSFEEVYRKERAALLRAVHSLVRDWQKAEDVVQEAFLDLHRKLSAGEVLRDPAAFLRSSA